ncbi:MAG: ABC transporter permease [Chryseolinea sp.]
MELNDRVLWRECIPGYSFELFSRNNDVYVLKVVTLAIAFAAAILVMLFSIHEFGYDKHHDDPNTLFRLLIRNTNKNFSGNRLSAGISYRSFKTIRNKLTSGIVARVKSLNGLNITISGKSLDNQHFHTADPAIKDIFSFDVEEGTISDFNESSSAIISRARSTQYFGNRSPLGQKIRLATFGDTITVVVVAMFKNFPGNSHEDFDLLINYDSATLARLSFVPDQSNVYARMPAELSAHPLKGIGDQHSEFLWQPIQRIYFGARVASEEARHGDIYSMSILIGIVALIFALALCSFVNLTTITLPYRSKEIAIKKLAGTTQRQLLFQFINESLTLTGVSLLLAVILLIVFNKYVSPQLGINVLQMMITIDLSFWGLVMLMTATVVAAPILVIVRFIRASPTRLLSTDTISFPRFKRVIAIVQFGVSVFLIVSSTVVRRQIDHSLLKEPGQNNDQIVYMACPINISDSAIYRIRGGWPDRNPRIVDVIATSQIPGRLKGKHGGSELYALQVDYNFMDFFQLKMHEGRWFKPTDNDSATVLNVMALTKPKSADQYLIGTIEDLNVSLNRPEQPVKIRLAPNGNYNWLCFRVLEVDIRNTIHWIETRMIAKGSHGRAYFLNQHFEYWLNYQDRLNALSALLTIVSAILAGCAILWHVR